MLMVLHFNQFYTQVLNMLTIHFSCSLYIPTVLYILYVFNKSYPSSTQGHVEVPGGGCHGMCLGATISHSTKKGWEHMLWHLCSKWGYLLSVPDACTNIPSKRSMTSLGHHVMMSGIIWWCTSDVGDFRWWHLHQYWRGIKERMHGREGVPS